MLKYKKIIKENIGAIVIVSILTLFRAFSALVIPISFSYLSEDGINVTSLIILLFLVLLNLAMNVLIVKAEKKNTPPDKNPPMSLPDWIYPFPSPLL